MMMRNRKLLTLVVLVVISILSISLIPYYPVLAIEDGATGRLLAFGDRKHMEQFQIHYIHSIHKTPVIELYQLIDGQIVQQQITYDEFAVGMPSNVEGEGQFLQKDGHYIISGMNRVFPYLDIRIAQVMPDHGILFQDRLILFESIAPPGSWIRIKDRKISLWQMMKGVDLLER